jgi:peptide/nickel transport system substrate-binding protein
VNFGGFNDPEINQLLEDGRAESDPAAQKEIYENLNREFAKKLYNVWAQYTLWNIASKPTIHGVLGPDLPDGSGPFPGLATGHPVAGMWVDQ